jgi:hypothetical protein
VNNGASATKAALNATFVPKWKATTAYAAGDPVVNPSGDVVTAIASFTSGPTYDATKWVSVSGDKDKKGTELPVDIIVLAGQSNAMDKSDWITSGPVDVADPRVMHWDEGTGKPVTIPNDHTYLGLYVAQSYLREFPNRRVLIVPAAVGSTGFTSTALASPPAGYHAATGSVKGTWDRTLTTDPNNLYTRMVTLSNAAKAWVTANSPGSPTQIQAVIWSQGEEDARYLTQAQYATKLDDLITQFKIDMSDTFNKMPFVIGSFVPEVLYNDGTLPYEVPYALEDTPRRKQYTAYISGPRHFSKYNENVHYSVAGQKERGRLMVEGIRKARMNSALNEPNLPHNVRVQRSGDDVLVTWDAPFGRVTAYSLKTSIDKGATWVDASPARPVATEYRTTVPAATPFWVKVRATNEVGSTVYTIHEPYIITAPAYVAPQERYRASDLSAGAVTSWPSVAGSPVMAVNAGSPTSTTDTGEKVVTTNGTTDRMSVGATGIAWQTAAALVKLPVASTGPDYIFGPTNTTNGLVTWDSSTGKLTFTNGDATKVEVAATPGWHVVTATLGAAGAASIACDKVRVSGTIRNELPPAGIRVAGHFSSGQFIAASWSELALWNRVLTQVEIEQWVDAMHSLHPAIYP